MTTSTIEISYIDQNDPDAVRTHLVEMHGYPNRTWHPDVLSDEDVLGRHEWEHVVAPEYLPNHIHVAPRPEQTTKQRLRDDVDNAAAALLNAAYQWGNCRPDADSLLMRAIRVHRAAVEALNEALEDDSSERQHTEDARWHIKSAMGQLTSARETLAEALEGM